MKIQKTRSPLKIFLLVCLAVLLGAVFFHDTLIGIALEPVLERELADAFDMPFDVEGLRLHLWPGEVSVEKVVCYNPAGFKRREHYVAEGVRLNIDLGDLKKKCFHIRKAHFKKALFAIESYMTPGGSRTNVWHWYHHMGLDEEDPPSMLFPKVDTLSPDAAAAAMAAKGKWRVKIDHLELEDGTLIFDDRRDPDEHQWIFKKLKGYWDGFDFISTYTSNSFKEYIKLRGTFGENPPAKFEGEGKCQFADGDNFDVRTRITGGSIGEYDFLLAGLPGEVKGGTFDLISHARCLESNLQSEHLLTLRSLTFASPTAMQKLMKYPLQGVLTFLQTHKTIELEMKVNGYIGDPKFHVLGAFTKAFQKSLGFYAKATVNGLTKGTVKIAAETPNQLKNGFGMLTDILTSPFLKGADEDSNGKA
jgi:hypothetical protein